MGKDYVVYARDYNSPAPWFFPWPVGSISHSEAQRTYLSSALYCIWLRTLAGTIGYITWLLPTSLISCCIWSHYIPCPLFSSQHQLYAMPWTPNLILTWVPLSTSYFIYTKTLPPTSLSWILFLNSIYWCNIG